MRLALNYHNMMQEAIGENGFTKNEVCALPIEAAIWGMKAHRGNMKWRELPYNQDAVVEKIEAVAKNVRKKFEAFVVLGIGGSALGKPGFAQKKAELDAARKKKEEYIVR